MHKPSCLLVVLLLLLSSCEELFEYHPNQIRLDAHEKDLTALHLARISTQSAGDTLRLLVMGDTQRFYDDAVDFVAKANAFRDIDFVVHQGDISDFGMAQEHKWVQDILKQLKWPCLTVIGNHDLLANGRNVYREMYGALNYAFVYGHTKFVFLDTNGREYGFNGKVPDLGWLQEQVTPAPGASWQQAVVISHMPPFSSDFDSRLALPFHQALQQSGRVRLSLHGHDHNWNTVQAPDSPVTYHVTTTVKNRGFSFLQIWEDGFAIERIQF